MDEFDDNLVPDLVAGLTAADKVLMDALETYSARNKDFPKWGPAMEMASGVYSISFCRQALAVAQYAISTLRRCCQEYHDREARQ